MTETELCRLCAESKDTFVGICDAEGRKLAIEEKIAKCLQIQILVTDGLPLTVCVDCCCRLNQCHEFFEKTNRAQESLRQLMTISKSEQERTDSNAEYAENIKISPKEETILEERRADPQIPDHHTSESVTHIVDNYFKEDNKTNTFHNYNTDENEETIKGKKCKIQGKKSLKQNKKKVKKKSQMEKIEDLELNTIMDCETEKTDGSIRSNNMKARRSYRSGTEADAEVIELQSHSTEMSKAVRKRGDTLERYPWLCSDCNDKLPSLETLEEHHETVHNQQPKYMCVKCCKVYDKYCGFLTHVKRHSINAKYRCEDCGKCFVHKKVLDSHKMSHTEERSHVCQTCGKTFRQQSALYVHSRCHLPETMKNRYPCDQCDKRFSTKPNLVTHKRIHSGVRNFTCDQCGKSFIQKGNLEAHFLTHSEDKPYKCPQCPKAFKTPLQLKKHETVHTGARPHQCAVCGRTFREKGTLREHHRIHTGAMPFACEFCGKCFRFKGILTTHRRQHTGERPYSCLECQHHFTNWPNYNKHMKRRHGINTSHAKNPASQQLQTQSESKNIPTNQSPDPDSEASEDPLSTPQIEEPPHVQVIQQVPQTVTTTANQTFQTEVSGSIQESMLRERNNAYFNAVPAAFQHFLSPNLPYNFYNISNVSESDLVQQR